MTRRHSSVRLMSYSEWCKAHNCDHAHCPHDCDHPQPFVLADGRLVCGRCAIIDHELVEMVPCTPEHC